MTENIKKDDLYVFNPSKLLLNSLELMYFNDDDVEVSGHVEDSSADQEKKEENTAATTRTPIQKVEPTVNATFCNVCKIEIDTRDHYKTDFHRFNLKRSVNSLPPISEVDFQELFSKENDSEESISGSEDDDEEEEDEDEDEDETDVAKDIYKTEKDSLTTIFEDSIGKLNIADETKDQSDTRGSYLNTKSPFVLMKSDLLPENKVLGSYKSLYNTMSSPIEQLQTSFHQSDSSAIFMVGGGHFAGAIISHSKLKNITFNKKIDLTLQEQQVNILHHKTFHRYTTRRKQGGSQSAMDNAKGKANSAGSTLRRYNEAALKLDIQKLLQDWSAPLSKCKYIFIRANGVSNRKILVGEGSPLEKNDTRLMNLPFTTNRPTTSELKRSWCKISYFQLLNKPETKKAPVTVAKDSNVPKEKKVEKAEETKEEVHGREMIQLLKKAKAPLLISYLRKNKLDVNMRLEPQEQFAPNTATLLHYASNNGLKNMVYILLNTLKADPTIKNSLGRVAADLTTKKEIKQAFQLARNSLGEKYAAWDLDAHVGPPLTREDIEAEESEKQDLQSKELEEKLEEVREEQKQAQLEKTKLDKVIGTPLQPTNLQQTLNSLTPEQKMRYMREQRARAAEARMNAAK